MNRYGTTVTFHANRYDGIEWRCGKRDEPCASPDHDVIGGSESVSADEVRDVDCEECLLALELVGKAATRRRGHLQIMRHKSPLLY